MINRRNLFLAHESVANFGIYPEDVVQAIRADLVERHAFDPAVQPSQRHALTSTERMLLAPPVFSTFKNPDTRGYNSNLNSEREKLLYAQANMLRDILLPLCAAIRVWDSEGGNISHEILQALKSKLILDIQETNFGRLLNKVPDALVRIF